MQVQSKSISRYTVVSTVVKITLHLINVFFVVKTYEIKKRKKCTTTNQTHTLISADSSQDRNKSQHIHLY